MCGIAVIFQHHSDDPVSREEMRRMLDRMQRRGPDGEGQWYSPDDRVGLGHRRLAIIDLTEDGAQPMRSADGNCVITNLLAAASEIRSPLREADHSPLAALHSPLRSALLYSVRHHLIADVP